MVGKQNRFLAREAHALPTNHSGQPFAASRVCDERSGKNRRPALDPAPVSQPLPVSLDFADAFIDILSCEGPPLSKHKPPRCWSVTAHSSADFVPPQLYRRNFSRGLHVPHVG